MCRPTDTSQKTNQKTYSVDSVKATSPNALKSKVPTKVYSWEEPKDSNLKVKDHFSSLLFGGSVANTLLEFVLLAAPYLAMFCFGSASLDVPGSMPFLGVANIFLVSAIVRRVYNAYMEAVFFSFPQYRTQPVKEHKLKRRTDLMGRDIEQLELLDWHDKMTMISQFALNFGLYFVLPGFYPVTDESIGFVNRFVKILLNHYLLSFGMYWAHRSCHVVPYLWEKIHSIHHWAKHPLSRNTYEDHWFDNFANAIIGHTFAQILVPLDGPAFWFSRIFRIFESLEKHSGVSCGFNLAHSVQQWLPFAQMPHHHDWHHEGFKGSNYTFSSLGGLWDCLFGTRKVGRCSSNNWYSATREDKSMKGEKAVGSTPLPDWFSPLYPLVGLTVAVFVKLSQ